MTPRVVVVSDSHFSPRTPEAEQNWDAVVRHLETVEPDLVVHVGDITVDGAHRPDELGLARRQLDRIPGEWLVVPGNHDVGDNPGAGGGGDDDVTEERVARWIEALGADRWVAELEGWRLVGVDAQLFGSGSAGEDEQWSFLEAALHPARRTVLVTHKALTADAEEVASAPPYRFVPQPARQRLVELCRRGGVEVVLSGHVHQRRHLEAAGMTHLWVSTTWAVLPDWLQATVGAKRCGILELTLPSDGDVEIAWVEPEGMAQLILGENVASPYEPAASDTTA